MEILNSPEMIITLALSLGLVVSMIVLLVLQVRNSNHINQLTYPAYEFTIKKAQNNADEILGQARKQAREIVASAEVQSRQIVEGQASEATKLRDVYERALSEMRESFTTQLAASIKATEDRSNELTQLFANSLQVQETDIKKKLDSIATHLEEMPDQLSLESKRVASELQERVARAGEEIERSLGGIQEESRQQISDYLMKKFTEAEADIATYRESRERILDRHLETLIKDVVRVTLQKELTADDHADLVRRALSEAREGSSI